MKRVIVIVGIALLALGGCTKEENRIQDQQETLQQEIEEEIKQLQVDATAFHFVVDWLSNEEILFVGKSEDVYELKTFNPFTKELVTVYEDDAMITDVLIHPLKEYFLIHTSTDAAATVKFVSLDGVVQNEVTIESAELEIAWNDLNPFYILFTAFYEDWSFDVFFFDGSKNDLQILPIENPFPKWLGEDQFITNTDESGLGNLYTYSIQTEQQELLDSRPAIFFDTYQDVLFTIEEKEDGQASYKILNSRQEVLGETDWPDSYEDFQYFMYNPEWVETNRLYFFQPMEDTALGMTDLHRLMRFDEDGLEVIFEDVEHANIACSPDGENCIIGKHFEHLVNMKTYEEKTWLLLDDPQG